jgi:hypothetical protein
LVFFASSVPDLQAQVNEKRALRDATGVYRGGTVGGQFTVTYDDGSPGFTLNLESETGKVTVPVKKGSTASGMKHPDLPSDEGTDDSGRAAGQVRQVPKVTRGGNRVVSNFTGGRIRVDDDPRKGDWTQGKGTSTFVKRGTAWDARTSNITSLQRNASVPGSPPDHSKRVSGLSLKGRG